MKLANLVLQGDLDLFGRCASSTQMKVDPSFGLLTKKW
jgi:hypothetical protein